MNGKLTHIFSFRFKDVDFRNSDSWEQPVKNTMILAAFFGAFLIFFLLFNVGEYDALTTSQQQEITLKQALLQKIPKVMLLTAQKKQLSQLNTLIKQYSQALPQAEQLGTLLDDLNLAATNNGLDLLLLKPQKMVLTDFYAKVPVEVALRGSYQQFGQFFNQLARLPYYCYPREVTLQLPDSSKDPGHIAMPGVLALQMTIDMYHPIPKTTP